MQRVLAVWLPNWPLQRLLTVRPELRGQAVVLEAPSRRGQCVAACSREARAVGVEVGMPTAEAVALINAAEVSSRRAPIARGDNGEGGEEQRNLFEHDPGADRAALVQLAAWCHRFSPTTGVEQGEQPATILLDATNLAPLYGSEELFAAQVVEGCRRRGLEVRAALGATIGAAWALAHVAVGESGPLIVAASDRTREALAQLPLAALRLEEDLAETLHSLGAEQIGDVLGLPREQLRSRFGPQLLLRVDQALGATREVFAAVGPPEEFVVEQLFEYPQSNRETLHLVVRSLLERLAWMLARRCAGALRVACRFECEGARAAEVEIGLFQPTASPRHLLEILELEMERLRLRAPATAISLRAVRHAPLTEQQGVLFDEPRNLESSLRLAGLVDRLAGRLGREAVVRCRLAREAQPELGYVKEPLVDVAPRSAKSAQWRRGAAAARSESNPRGALDRPLHLFRRPAPLEAISVVPDGPPIQFRRGGRQHTVARHWGPERIETGWWRSQSVWRDYYRVETTAGERYWLYRRRRDGRWFLQGIFG